MWSSCCWWWPWIQLGVGVGGSAVIWIECGRLESVEIDPDVVDCWVSERWRWRGQSLVLLSEVVIVSALALVVSCTWGLVAG